MLIAVFSGAVAAALLSLELLHRRAVRSARSSLRRRIAQDGGALGADRPERTGERSGTGLGTAAGARSSKGRLRVPVLTAMRQRRELRRLRHSYSAELPRMLEVIALGMRSGLAFDAAFALYVHRFATPLAVVCRERFDVWEKGLMPREQGLKELARVVDVPIFARFAATASRALSYGAPMTRLLLELAAEARKAYRLEQQEAVAKAPVKMLLPTGALILPAMLLLVIGPILMDLLERMV